MDGKLSTTELRRRNRNIVFQYIYHAQTSKTKQDIATDLSLSLPTVTQNLNELIEAGVIQYSGWMDSNGGRRARTVVLAKEARFSIGVELSPKHIQIVALDLRLDEIAYHRIPCPFSNDPSYSARLGSLLEAFIQEFHLPPEKLLGIGLTLPGIIDEENGVIEAAPVLRVRKMPLSMFTGNSKYPIYVANDASAGGFAEWWNRRDTKNLAYLFIGKGVGGALLIDGKPYQGEEHRSAEFGHMTLVPGGDECSCGKKGCLEAYCSTARLTDDLGIQVEDFFASLKAGDRRYFDIWQRYLDYLAVAINNLHCVMDSTVILGGMLTPFLTDYMPDLRARLEMLSSFGGDSHYFHLGRCGPKANCIGGALHFIDDFLRSI